RRDFECRDQAYEDAPEPLRFVAATVQERERPQEAGDYGGTAHAAERFVFIGGVAVAGRDGHERSAHQQTSEMNKIGGAAQARGLVDRYCWGGHTVPLW